MRMWVPHSSKSTKERRWKLQIRGKRKTVFVSWYLGWFTGETRCEDTSESEPLRKQLQTIVGLVGISRNEQFIGGWESIRL